MNSKIKFRSYKKIIYQNVKPEIILITIIFLIEKVLYEYLGYVMTSPLTEYSETHMESYFNDIYIFCQKF